MSKIPDSSAAVWAIPAQDGVIEVCSYGGKYVVVIVPRDGERYMRSKRGMTFERAQRDATWLAKESLEVVS